MMTNKIEAGAGWRLLDPKELVEKGDEFLLRTGEWALSSNWDSPGREQIDDTCYRRRVSQAFKPCSYANPVVPPVKTHVVWAETPIQAEPVPKHLDADPGKGYRLVDRGDFILKGDEWLEKGGWRPTTLKCGTYKHYIDTPLRRNLASKPEYRPYANADEAALALQGKLIKHTREPDSYYHPIRIDENGIKVGSGHGYSYAGLSEYWVFADGTPCGIRTN